MAEVKWTDEQLAAINERGGTLLVSAAAGSGKTAVLTQRIIELIKNGEADISRLLVVTFTRASAADLKQKLTRALNRELSADPGNRRLRGQQLAVGRARISTIDSFFNEIVRSGFQKLGLPADFGILDEAENSMLMRGVMEELLDALYEEDAWASPDKDSPARGITSEMFYRTVEALIGGRDDARLSDALHSLYQKCIARPQPFKWLEDEAELFRELEDSPEPLDTRYGDILRGYIKDYISIKLGGLDEALDTASEHPFASRYGDWFAYLEGYIFSLSEADSYDALRERASSFSPPRLKNKSKDGSDVSDALDAVRDRAKDAAERLSEVIAPAHLLRKAAADTREAVEVLTEILKRYDRALTAEKLRRARLSFSDLSRYALKLLLEERDGQWVPTPAALELSGELDGIFVDEYQDTNLVQDMIFRALDRGGKRFMVGDVKQSIYRFRGALPEIFAGYMKSFPESGEGRVLSLPHNFRSDPPVLDFCNRLFSSLFSEELGGVDYSGGHALKPGKSECADYPVELYLVDGGEDEGDGEEKGGFTLPAQATFAADRIRRILEETDEQGNPKYSPEDVAVLVRSTPNVLYFQRALEAAGVPCRSEKSENFLECPEVLIALSLLQVIDNPLRDIYLAGALRSPVFGMTLGDIIELRGESSGGALYCALEARAAAGDEQSETIVKRIERWRTAARALPVDKLIRRVYEDTGLPEIAAGADKGGVRHINLMLLYQSARSFESTSYKGLYSFLEYIDDAMKGQTRIESARLDTGEGAVSVMTIHKSKGLQFKVCVLADAARRFNRSDSTGAIVTHEALGACFKLPDVTGMGRYNTPMRYIASHYADKQSVSEEARVLYVALTRAAERLIICGETSDAAKYIEMADALPLTGPGFFSCQSMMDWMCAVILRDRASGPLREYAELDEAPGDSRLKLICGVGRAVSFTGEERGGKEEATEEYALGVLDEVRARFDYIYPDIHLTRLPSKLSVSELHPGALDRQENAPVRRDTPPRPAFMLERQATAADIGIAMHTFMQFCDFGQSAREGCARQAEILLEKRFLTPEARALLDIPKLDAFFRSPLYGDIASADEVYRELRFNISLPASDYTNDKELKEILTGRDILVQGVADLFFRRGDKWTVVDFKTDALYSSITEQELAGRHRAQLSHYVRAVKEMCGADKAGACVYSFALGKAVDIEVTA